MVIPVEEGTLLAVSLRPQHCDDMPVLGGGDSPFDDFGPASPRAPRPARLDADGGLSVIAGDGQVAELFFRHTTVNRVEAHTDVENLAEQRALQAAGFQREAVTRGAQWRDGAYHDGILYAVLRADPRPAPPA